MDIVDWLRRESELVALDRLGEAADEIARLRAALQKISDTFKRDREQGYETKDKTFAIDIADMALKDR